MRRKLRMEGCIVSRERTRAREVPGSVSEPRRLANETVTSAFARAL